MKLYCMCQITGSVPEVARDSQGFGPVDNQTFFAPNRFGVMKDEPAKTTDQRPVILNIAMICKQTGIHQEISKTFISNPWAKTKEIADIDFKRLKEARRHYPNVDLYECPHCRTQIVIED